MAKVMKDTRKTIDVDAELKNIKKSSEKKESKLDKDSKKKKETKKKDVKNTTKKASFFKEVKNEMSKVKWPSKKDMIKYSIATILFIIFFALFFYLIDLVMALLKEVF